MPGVFINAVATNSTVPTTPRAAAQEQAVPLSAAAPTTATAARKEGGSRPEDKIQAVLDRYGKTFCEEMGVGLN